MVDQASRLARAPLAAVVVVACGPAQPSSTAEPLVIREANPDLCPAAALPPAPAHFRIDPAADEHVIVIGADGQQYRVAWAPGFVPGTIEDPVVRNPSGAVVARDGERLEGARHHGHQVCSGSGSVYVLLH